MKEDIQHIEKTKVAFFEMQTPADLLHLLNEIKPLVYGKSVTPFSINLIYKFAYSKNRALFYKPLNIPKKNGGVRIIHRPIADLKAVQKSLAYLLQCIFEPHNAAFGFVKNKSIVQNAEKHVGSYYVYNIDLRNFFDSIDQARVWKCLQLDPFNLKFSLSDLFIDNNDIRIKPFIVPKLGKVSKSNLISKTNLAGIIANLCCVEKEVERLINNKLTLVKRNVLPQGAPTSPIITNVVCQRLDYLLTGLAKRQGLKYSRYADDITFSSMHNVYQPDSEFLKELNRIITDQGFFINEKKTRLQKNGYKKEVTGLLVNEKTNVQQRYIKQLRMWLYYWENYGFEKASSYFLKQYISDKGHVKNGKFDMNNVIQGKLDYLRMVKGADSELYQKLKHRFDKITRKITNETINVLEIENAERNNIQSTNIKSGHIELTNIPSTKKNNNTLTKVKNEEKTIPVYHKPKELVALLKNFSLNDSALKYTTHSWDAGRDANMFENLSEFLSIAKSQYSEFSYALKDLSENLNGKIYNFLFNKDIAKSGWGDINPKKRIYFGWSSPELVEACKNDISLNPEDFILPAEFQIQRSGKTLQKFKHIIDVFKNEIEVRDENSALLNLIIQKHDNYLISFSPPEVFNLENKTFYTDIQWFSKGLDLIFEGIQKYPQHPTVEYTVTENNNDMLILTILHRNSFKKGLSINDDKLNLKRGDFSTIKEKLRNLCDWSIESEFAEGAYRINYLVSNKEIPSHNKITSAEGFKHILTFYK